MLQLSVGKDYRLSGEAVRRAITRNTVLVVDSSPCFPHGVMDHVQDIAQVQSPTHCPAHRMHRMIHAVWRPVPSSSQAHQIGKGEASVHSELAAAIKGYAGCRLRAVVGYRATLTHVWVGLYCRSRGRWATGSPPSTSPSRA